MLEPEPTPVRLHPNLPELYRQKVAQLREAVQDPAIRDEALELLRGLIAKVTVRPGEGYVELVVEGALTAMLALGAGAKSEVFASCSGNSVKVVAGQDLNLRPSGYEIARKSSCFQEIERKPKWLRQHVFRVATFRAGT